MALTRRLRIIIPGGTGRLGTLLARHLHEQGHSVSTIARYPKAYAWEAIHWDAENFGHWSASLDGADAVINLAGRSVHCRYTPKNKQAILRSRVRTSELVGQAIAQSRVPPRVWLNGSVTDAELEERTFNTEVATAWEAAVLSQPTPATRKVLLRIAPVMSPDSGGMFDDLLRLVRWGIGGEIGDGEQYVAWIHDIDFVRAVEFLIDREDIQGPVTVAAPEPMPNHQFMCNMRRAWCTSYFGLPVRDWLVKTAAFALRTEPELLLKSRNVMPERLLDAGFSFDFPEWRRACENLVERWRRCHEN